MLIWFPVLIICIRLESVQKLRRVIFSLINIYGVVEKAEMRAMQLQHTRFGQWMALIVTEMVANCGLRPEMTASMQLQEDQENLAVDVKVMANPRESWGKQSQHRGQHSTSGCWVGKGYVLYGMDHVQSVGKLSQRKCTGRKVEASQFLLSNKEIMPLILRTCSIWLENSNINRTRY